MFKRKSDKIGFGLIVLACLAAAQYHIGESTPAKATDSVAAPLCTVSYETYMQLPPRARDTDLFACTGELIYDAGGANMPSNRRDQIWRFNGADGHTILIHTFRGKVVEKTWQ